MSPTKSFFMVRVFSQLGFSEERKSSLKFITSTFGPQPLSSTDIKSYSPLLLYTNSHFHTQFKKYYGSSMCLLPCSSPCSSIPPGSSRRVWHLPQSALLAAGGPQGGGPPLFFSLHSSSPPPSPSSSPPPRWLQLLQAPHHLHPVQGWLAVLSLRVHEMVGSGRCNLHSFSLLSC